MGIDESITRTGRTATALAWTRLVVVTASRGLIAMVAGLALWAVGPALLGWHVTTVSSDSMRPAIAAGDVVAARPADADQLQAGQVLLFADPDHAERLRLHRYAESTAEGAIITKGDANPKADSSPVDASDVTGVGVLRVPLFGQPVVWAQTQQWVPFTATTVVLLAALVIAVQPAVRRGAVRSEAPPPGWQAPPDDHRLRSHRQGPAGMRRRRRSRRRGSTVVAAVALASIGLALATPISTAHAAFASSTGQHATLAAAVAAAPQGLQCTTNSDRTSTVTWEHPGGGQSFTLLVDGRPAGTLGPDARSAKISLSSLFSWSRQKISIRSELGGSWSATSSTVSVSVFSFLGLGSVRCV